MKRHSYIARRAFAGLADSWGGRELWLFPNTVEKIVSTTGAGDTAIAGFLAAALRGVTPEKALETAATAAWLCIQSSDTTGMLHSYEQVEALSRDAARTETLPLSPERWRPTERPGLYRGRNDACPHGTRGL